MLKPTSSSSLDTRFLDGLRGIAAFYVLVWHACLLMTSYGFGGQKETGVDRLILWGLKLFSHPAVAVFFFFVLSGFVIHLRYARQLKTEPEKAEFGWGGYMWRRIRRLYPPLLFAVVLTAGFDLGGKHLGLPVYGEKVVSHDFQDEQISSFDKSLAERAILAAAQKAAGTTKPARSTEPAIASQIVPTTQPIAKVTPPKVDHHIRTESDLSIPTLIANLTFINDLDRSGPPRWGTNGPLWSLALEWWFYVLYPIFWFLTRRSVWLATFMVLGAYALSYHMGNAHAHAAWFQMHWPGSAFTSVFSNLVLPIKCAARVLRMFPLWWAGVLLADVAAGRIRIKLAWLIPLIPLILLDLVKPKLIGMLAHYVPGTIHGMRAANYIVQHVVELGSAIGVVGVVALCFTLTQRGYTLTVLRKLKPLGDMSYTLYIIHMPILVFVGGLVIQKTATGYRPPHSLVPFLLTVGGIMLLAYVAHFFVEKPFTGGAKRKIVLSAEPGNQDKAAVPAASASSAG